MVLYFGPKCVLSRRTRLLYSVGQSISFYDPSRIGFYYRTKDTRAVNKTPFSYCVSIKACNIDGPLLIRNSDQMECFIEDEEGSFILGIYMAGRLLITPFWGIITKLFLFEILPVKIKEFGYEAA